MSAHGVLLVNKPMGITSHDVVQKLRRKYQTQKIGHTGTLDPMVDGLMIICLGQATKLAQFLVSDRKTYRVCARIGLATTTEDLTGAITESQSLNEPDLLYIEKHILEVLQSFVGSYSQLPPMYSAVKINGKKLYEYARQNIAVERVARDMAIYDIALDTVERVWEKQQQFIDVSFTVSGSKGLYVRTMCVDIGKALGFLATMKTLTRISTGNYQLDSAKPLQQILTEHTPIIPISEINFTMPRCYVSSEVAAKLWKGYKLPAYFVAESYAAPFCVYEIETGTLIGIFQPSVKYPDKYQSVVILPQLSEGALPLKVMTINDEIANKGLRVLDIPVVVGIGYFDGVHKGHKALLRKAKDIARHKGCKVAVLTFDFAQTDIAKSIELSPMLTLPKEKKALVTQENFDYYLTITFTDYIKSLTAEAFIQLICALFPITDIVVGKEFQFGSKRSGTIVELEEYQKIYQYDLHCFAPIMQNKQQKISSSTIKTLIAEGNIELANRLLGYQYAISGKVIHGEKRGREIGFPTANVMIPPHKLTPLQGVFISRVTLKEQSYAAITNVGVAPTVKRELLPLLETHILGFEGDLYDCTVQIVFIKKLRDEQKFSDITALISQIQEDVMIAQQFFD